VAFIIIIITSIITIITSITSIISIIISISISISIKTHVRVVGLGGEPRRVWLEGREVASPRGTPLR
jgi:hypothetical protein